MGNLQALHFSANWITAPIGLAVMFTILYLLITGRRGAIKGAEEGTSIKEDLPAKDTNKVEELARQVEELEGEKATLEAARKEDDKRIREEINNNARTYQYSQTVNSELSALKTQYKWLHEMADEQAKDISSYVVVERVRFCYHDMNAPIPFLIFAVDVHNKSVFDINIENGMDENIKIAGERLLGEKELINNPKISPSGKESLTIKQRLSPTEVGLVTRCENEPLGAFYYFEKLVIMIAARTEFPRFERTPLTLPNSVGSKDNKIAQLEDELTSLHRRSETIVKLSMALGGAYTLAHLFETGGQPSKEMIEHWFNSTLRGHIHPDQLEVLREGLPELTDSPIEQKDLIDKYCFKLRRLIAGQRQE